MRIAFIGGGSLRVLPIVRALLKQGGILQNGAVALIDRDTRRSDAVASMIRRCPEFEGSGCEVRSFTDMQEGLTGVDSLYVTMATTREPSWTESIKLSAKLGIWTSDQLSTEGCLAAVRCGDAILHFARVMEKVAAPNATMLIFGNPVAVFSALVNKYTKIKAFGICQGFRNHKYDIPAICGKQGYDDSVEAVSAGVNHYAFMNSGSWKGKDVFAHLDSALKKYGRNFRKKLEDKYPGILGMSYSTMLDDYDRNGTFMISSEADGVINLEFKPHFDFVVYANRKRKSDPEMSAAGAQKRYEHFYSLLDCDCPEIWEKDPLCTIDDHDLSNDIYAALCGKKTFRIFASALNNGAVKGFPDDYVLEYSMDISRKGVKPVKNLFVPQPHFALVMQFAMCQTMLADTIAEHSPKKLAAVLNYWPQTLCHTNCKEYNQTMLDIHADLPDYAKAAREFIR